MSVVALDRLRAELDGVSSDLLVENAPEADVSGPISGERRGFLGGIFRRAMARAKYAMERAGLYPVNNYPAEELVAEPIHPENGFVGGYTDGNRVTINTYSIPGTEHYRSFMVWLKNKRGEMASYLYDKLGTPARAEKMTEYVTSHETLHVFTQLREMETAGGEKINFRKLLFRTLRDRYESNLPKGLKCLAPVFAYISHRPILEALNEVATENVYNGKTAPQIGRERREKPAYYDKLAANGADVLCDMNNRYNMGLEPGNEVLDFYRLVAGNRSYIDRLIDRSPSIIQIAPAQSYSKAA